VRLSVLLFAHYRELVPSPSVEIEVRTGATVRDAIARLRAMPGWEDLPEEPTVAVNREYSQPDRELHAGDELALIPPVAGG